MIAVRYTYGTEVGHDLISTVTDGVLSEVSASRRCRRS
jgi:hypothetical protein